MAVRKHKSRHVTRTIERWARWVRRHLVLWILAASAVDTALLALVAVLISLPGQSGKAISSLLAALLVLLALSVAFPVAGRMVEDRDRKAEHEQTRLELAAEHERARRQQVDQLLTQGSAERLPRLSDVSNDVLGATPTRYSIEGAAPYVARNEADGAIRSLLAKPGPPYPFVIVWGTTKAGKSRALAEALRAMFTDNPAVVVPRGGGQALAELARLGIDGLVKHCPAVVVLDNLDPAGLTVVC